LTPKTPKKAAFRFARARAFARYCLFAWGRISGAVPAALNPNFKSTAAREADCLREQNGKAWKDCASQGEIGGSSARNGRGQHDIHGRSGAGTQGKSATGWFVDAARDDSVG